MNVWGACWWIAMAHAARLSPALAAIFGLAACESLEPCPPSHSKYPPKAFLAFFDLGSAKVTERAMNIVQAIASDLQPGEHVVIEAHTDGSGDPMANLILSFRRGQALRDALAAKGVEPSRVAIRAQGDQSPLVQTKALEPHNRRAELRVIPNPSPGLPQGLRREDYRCIASRTRLVPDK